MWRLQLWHIHMNKTHLSYSKNLFSWPTWNPHPAKKTSCQKPSPFKGKSPVIAKGPQGHWSHDNIYSFISMWDFNSPFHPSLSQIPQAANSGTEMLAESYDRLMLMLSHQFCFSVCVYFIVPFHKCSSSNKFLLIATLVEWLNSALH